MNKMRYLAMLFTSGFIGLFCFLMVSPKRRAAVQATSRRQYLRMAIFFKTEQLWRNVERRFDLIVELSELTVNNKQVKLKQYAAVMKKANGVMLKILNHISKFTDKDKLLNICIAYIQMIESLTDLERLEDETIEDRRMRFLLQPLLLSLRHITHPNFPLEDVIKKETGTVDMLLRVLLRRALTLYRPEHARQDDLVSILILTHVLSKNCTSTSQPVRALTEKVVKALKGQVDKCVQGRDMEGDWERIAIAVESTSKSEFICDAYAKLVEYLK